MNIIAPMKKTTAKACANIAFIKYWGRKQADINLPNTATISMNLSNLITTTTVEFSQTYKKDQINIDGEDLSKESNRVINHLDRIRQLAKIALKARVVSKNSFPHSSGLASSASGFAALTLAATKAAGLNLTQKQLSILARLGSGSAARSIPDGFSELTTGKSHQSSYAYSLHPANFWKINALAVIVSFDKKGIGSLEGHKAADSSPFYQKRLQLLPQKISRLKLAVKQRNFPKFGEILEQEALELHAIALTSQPPIVYWNPGTLEVIKLCQNLKTKGLLCYYTIDAGPQLVVFCLPKDTKKIVQKLQQLTTVKQVIINSPGKGAGYSNKHLF